jgi:hypothetical protein
MNMYKLILSTCLFFIYFFLMDVIINDIGYTLLLTILLLVGTIICWLKYK